MVYFFCKSTNLLRIIGHICRLFFEHSFSCVNECSEWMFLILENKKFFYVVFLGKSGTNIGKLELLFVCTLIALALF